MSSNDDDGDGLISLDEFIRMVLKLINIDDSEQDIKDAFKVCIHIIDHRPRYAKLIISQ